MNKIQIRSSAAVLPGRARLAASAALSLVAAVTLGCGTDATNPTAPGAAAPAPVPTLPPPAPTPTASSATPMAPAAAPGEQAASGPGQAPVGATGPNAPVGEPNPVAPPSGEEISCVPAARTILVAQDGSGQFTTIKEAWDSVPDGNEVPTLISIRNGIYSDRIIMADKAFVTLRGEDRAETRVELELGTDIVCENDDDAYGCAIWYVSGAHDLAFENLTLANTWTGGGKAIAWRAQSSTRIILKDVDLPGNAGDTHYTSGGGLYYYSGVFISGTYHIIVPRMTTWISDSTFECMDDTKCLFNESNTEESQKLVIVNSTIEGVNGFSLGSYFRDAAWYFIDVKFSANMADRPIYREQETDELKWGIRQYFAGSSGATYDWLQDNIATSPAGTKEQVTLGWMFPDWNPGDTLVCAE